MTAIYSHFEKERHSGNALALISYNNHVRLSRTSISQLSSMGAIDTKGNKEKHEPGRDN